jgi:hypothetical protein
MQLPQRMGIKGFHFVGTWQMHWRLLSPLVAYWSDSGLRIEQSLIVPVPRGLYYRLASQYQESRTGPDQPRASLLL